MAYWDSYISDVLSRTVKSEYHRQIWTTWFLWKKGVLIADIHWQLAAVCGEAAPSHRTVFHLAETFNSGHETVKKGISPGCLPRARISLAVRFVSCIIMEYRHVTVDEPQLTTSLCHAKICAINHEHLMVMKVHAPWVPRDLMPKQKERRVQNCHELLTLHKNQEGLFARLFTGDESWFHFKLRR
jgi:hypothetical protein